jgi:hypothetical protein
MPKLFVESEYDMDVALAETVKLVKLNHASLDVGFNNTFMVGVFLDNLQELLKENKITPENRSFKLNILVPKNESTKLTDDEMEEGFGP